jgi:hypothetical protein
MDYYACVSIKGGDTFCRANRTKEAAERFINVAEKLYEDKIHFNKIISVPKEDSGIQQEKVRDALYPKIRFV